MEVLHACEVSCRVRAEEPGRDVRLHPEAHLAPRNTWVPRSCLVFASRTVDEWRERLATFSGVWAVNQSAQEVLTDPQVLANGYLQPGLDPSPPLQVIASPAQFDRRPLGPVRRAPECGQHTEELLLENGYSWDQIIAMKEAGAIN